MKVQGGFFRSASYILIGLRQPVEAGAGAGQGEELPGDGGVGDGHDQGGEH